MKLLFPVLAGWLCIQALGAQTATPSIDEILARVQTNTGQFEQSLPDFVCDEGVVSLKTERGVMTHEGASESHFTGLQKRSGRMTYTESREFVTINGRPAKPGATLYGVFLMSGGFSSLLDETFSAKFAPLHDFKIAGHSKWNDRAALVLEFATKPGQKLLGCVWDGEELIQKDTGKAWIDEKTIQVLHIERRFMNLPQTWRRLVATVDYGPVTIDGRPFWMPLRVKADQTGAGGAVRQYIAEYRNYRKFEVSSGIDYQTVP